MFSVPIVLLLLKEGCYVVGYYLDVLQFDFTISFCSTHKGLVVFVSLHLLILVPCIPYLGTSLVYQMGLLFRRGRGRLGCTFLSHLEYPVGQQEESYIRVGDEQ